MMILPASKDAVSPSFLVHNPVHNIFDFCTLLRGGGGSQLIVSSLFCWISAKVIFQI